MVKKRGLASNRGLDALLGSIKTEKLITGNLIDASVRAAVDDAKSAEKLNAKSTDDGQNISDDESAEASATIAVVKKSPTVAVTPQPFTPKPAKTVTSNTHNASINNDNDNNNIAGLNLMHINVAYLQRGKYQPRIDLDEDALQELATSIKQHGVMQPIVIRPLAKVLPNSPITHEIIAGERRWRAAQIAGLTHIPAIMRPMSDDLAIALALIENIQREDLSVMEQAAALQRFHDEFGMSHSQIADVVGKARTTVSNLLRLNQLHDDVKQALNEGQMDMGHARALLALSPKQQPVIAKKIIQGQLTVRQTEALVKDILNPKAPTQSQEIDYDRLRLNQHLSEQLGAVVKIKGSSKGKGSIEIFFHNEEELQALIVQFQSQLEH
ncbi:chromosome partitioning protein ParB [Moraxella osloensis]|uniref:Probable chromosome-partitioning protein ParB n=1 Tax=Faucicola osloensis TaxID=34062 RepID=A0A378QAA4_FAUOS|nr:ParB/RepB/Spo0J family partition protein [Moraxella osloensis]AME00589.1 chromosome partitioning protein ParB [Moraxella osloensis]OBX57282.1 chromosome partitioning protein ParB [Moraxella osloensis]QPT41818.1 ParB/RepB/Spo0J family partition protein [Moraxella osloensis]STY97406.1 Probable chromosome-partitioning protein parB [Moraxella osloensis]